MKIRLSSLSTFALCGALAWFAGGSLAARGQTHTSAFAGVPGGIIFAADGAGDFRGTSKTVKRVLQDEGLPFQLETFEWSHGRGKVIRDQRDSAHLMQSGLQLAERVKQFQAMYPGQKVYLLGHSAGGAVVLHAAESLPPGSVDRILLLAPSVSPEYDLRPTLRATRDTVEVFYSRKDTGYCGWGTTLIGTTDGHHGPAAGQKGFSIISTSREDALLYIKLRQHAWDSCLTWCGNKGGHYGAYQPGFLKAYIIPMLLNR